MIWRLTSLQNGCRLALRTPFLSSENCSSGRKNSFLAFWPNALSSLLQGIPNGRSVTQLMSCGVSFKVNPLKFTVVSILDLGCRDINNYSITSSSWPWILLQKVIQLAWVNRSTTSGVSRNFLEFEGSFLINPPGMVRMLCFGLCSDQKGNSMYAFLLWFSGQGFSEVCVSLCTNSLVIMPLLPKTRLSKGN